MRWGIVCGVVLGYLAFLFVCTSFVGVFDYCENRNWDGSLVVMQVIGEDIKVLCNKAPETDAMYKTAKAFIWPWGEI